MGLGYNGRYVSSQAIIERVFANAYKDVAINFSDILTWIADIMESIGAPVEVILQRKTTNGLGGNPDPIQIIDYKGFLPCDLDSLIEGSVRDYDTKIQLLPTTDLFFDTTANTSPTEIRVADGNSVNLPTQTFYVDENGYPIIPDDIEYIRSRNQNSSYIYTRPATQVQSNYTYMIQGNYIKVGYKQGKVELTYEALYTDTDGFPLIPDNFRYINAITWGIIERMDYILFRAGRISKSVYDDTRQRALFALPSAANAMRLQNLDKMESLKNSYLRLIPRINIHASAFQHLNVQERFNIPRGI